MLLYAGDHDPSGEDILRDFTKHTRWDHVERVALCAEQVREFNLPEHAGKRTDSRAAGFTRRHGRLVQVELEALDPDDLHTLYADALARYHNDNAFETAMQRETDDIKVLRNCNPQGH